MKYVRISSIAFYNVLPEFLILQVGKIFTHYGPDLLTSCGNPQHILSVGTTYVVGIGGFCSAYSEWTPYNKYPTEHRQVLANGCSPVDDNSSGVEHICL